MTTSDEFQALGAIAMVKMARVISSQNEQAQADLILSMAKVADTREKRAAILKLSTLLKAAWLENQ